MVRIDCLNFENKNILILQIGPCVHCSIRQIKLNKLIKDI
jgi:hypothetical protein